MCIVFTFFQCRHTVIRFLVCLRMSSRYVVPLTRSPRAKQESQLGVMGHMNFEISVTDWAPELTTSGAISPPRLPDTTDGPTAEMRPKLEVTETS